MLPHQAHASRIPFIALYCNVPLQEVRYTADYELLHMEQRVTRAEGRHTKDETQQLEARIRQLEAALAAVLAEHGMLAQEVKRAEEDYGRVCVVLQTPAVLICGSNLL